MNYEILEEPIQFRLHGVSSRVENEDYAETGCRLMNPMWETVKAASLKTTGITHWVYLPDDRMFVGVEVVDTPPESIPPSLELCEFELKRYLKHVHIGPYDALPQVWQKLKEQLDARGETMKVAGVEIHGHCPPEPSAAKTTILIGLGPQAN